MIDDKTFLLTPHTNKTVEFTIMPEGKIMLNNGTMYEKIHLIKGPTDDFEKTPRGIMLKVENPKFWKHAKQCFISHPAGVYNKPELWFSKDHDHDTGAVAPEFYYILPIP